MVDSRKFERRSKSLQALNYHLEQELTAETLARERDQFFSLSPDMFCIVDLNSHFFEINNTFVETLGYSREDDRHLLFTPDTPG